MSCPLFGRPSSIPTTHLSVPLHNASLPLLQYEHCISQLKLAMRKAEHMLRQLDEPLVLREHDWDSGRHQSGCDFLFTHAGLRRWAHS